MITMRLPIDTGYEDSHVDTESRTASNDVSGSLSLLVSGKQAAAIFRIGRTRFFDLVMSHAITSMKIRRRRLIVRVSLAEFVERIMRDEDVTDEERAVSYH